MSNRAAKYEQLHKSLKKHFKNVPEPGERSVLEHLIYACCLEEARHEQADEALAKLQQVYVDWNEIRVTTVIELSEAMSSLPNATQAGHRIKRCLQSLFEARYQYDVDDLKKANLSKASDEISSWKGVTPFILNYVSQNALGGHSIPVDSLGMEMLVHFEILTQAEAEKKSVPGLERAIPKNKGFEFGSLLHQFAVEFKQSPKNASVLAVFKELGVSPKPRAIEKPATKKEPKLSSAVTPVTSETHVVRAKSKTEAAASEASKKAGKPEPAPLAKKTEKPEKVAAAVGKSKDAPAKPESKPEPAKVIEPKKNVKADDMKKTEAKKPEVKKTEVKKPDNESVGKKQDKSVAKKPDAKSTSKSTSKLPEKAAPAKASKPELPTKKSVTTIKPSASRPDRSAKPTKKKPR